MTRFLTLIFVAAASAIALSGCQSVFEDGDCDSGYTLVKLTYDYNMKFADAYESEVNQVLLLAFNSATGKLAARVERLSSELTADHELVLDVPPGEYDLLVWAGDMNGSFDIARGEEGVSVAEDFHCRLVRDAAGESSTNIDRLFHGMLHVSLKYASQSEPNRYTVNLKKDTNVVRVVLQQLSGEPVLAERFEFTITDGNGWLNYDNTLRDNTPLTYRAWHTHSGSVDVNTDPKDPLTGRRVYMPEASRSVLGASLAEFTVSRLLMENKPMLTVRNIDEDRVVLSVPVIDYALLVKGFDNREMTDQQYLDRQDEYNMTFFLDENGRWLSSVIIINDWRIVRNVGDLE